VSRAQRPGVMGGGPRSGTTRYADRRKTFWACRCVCAVPGMQVRRCRAQSSLVLFYLRPLRPTAGIQRTRARGCFCARRVKGPGRLLFLFSSMVASQRAWPGLLSRADLARQRNKRNISTSGLRSGKADSETTCQKKSGAWGGKELFVSRKRRLRWKKKARCARPQRSQQPCASWLAALLILTECLRRCFFSAVKP
jgi:hypothetical protein